MPFTTGASFDPDSWVLLQGLTSQDLINDLSQVYEVKTVDELRLLSGLPDGKVVAWNDYHSTASGGGNRGIVNSGAHTDDGGSIFTLADGKYVEANLTKKINVKKFGARADGTQQELPIQACIDYLENANNDGGVVVIDDLYKCHGIRIEKNNITLDGAGYAGLLFRNDGNSDWIVDVELNAGVGDRIFNIDKLRIAGNTLAVTERGLRLQNMYGNSRIDVLFLGLQTCCFHW